MNKETRQLLLIPLEYVLYWELLFFFWWGILMGGNAPREFNYEWDFILLITVLFTTFTTPALGIVEQRLMRWINYRSVQIELGNREIHPVLRWISRILRVEKRTIKRIRKDLKRRGDRYYESG